MDKNLVALKRSGVTIHVEKHEVDYMKKCGFELIKKPQKTDKTKK